MQFSKKRSEAFKKKDNGLIYLTPEGHERLKEELKELKKILPARIVEAARTAAYGDRSDNAEYKQAKGALRWTNYRILEVEDQLKRVSVIPKSNKKTELIGLGSVVVLEARGGENKTFRILGPEETNPEEGAISFHSPLGKALMGKKKDEVVIFKSPRGEQEYKILEIE